MFRRPNSESKTQIETKTTNLTDLSGQIDVDKILHDLSKLDLKNKSDKEHIGDICNALAALNPELTPIHVNQIIDFAFAISDSCSPTSSEIFSKLDGIIPSTRLKEIMDRLTNHSRDLGYSSLRSDAYAAFKKMPLTLQYTDQGFTELMRCASPTDPFPKPILRSRAWETLIELYPALSATQKDQVIDAMLTTEYYYLMASIKTTIPIDSIQRIIPTLFNLCKESTSYDRDIGVLHVFREHLSREQLAEMHKDLSIRFPGNGKISYYNISKYFAAYADTIELEYVSIIVANLIKLPSHWYLSANCSALVGFIKIMPPTQAQPAVDYLISVLKNQSSAVQLEPLCDMLLELKKLGKTTAVQNKQIFDFLYSLHDDDSDHSIIKVVDSTLLSLDIDITTELRETILSKIPAYIPAYKAALFNWSEETIKRFKPFVSEEKLNLMVQVQSDKYRDDTSQFARLNLLRPPSLTIALHDCNKILATHRLTIRYEQGAITFETAVNQILAILNYFSDGDKVILFNKIASNVGDVREDHRIKTYNVLNRIRCKLHPQLAAKIAKSTLIEAHFFPTPLTDIVADYIDNMPTRLSR